MKEQHPDEIDLIYVLQKFREQIRKWVALGFKGVDFIIRYWVVILIVAIAGAAVGYFSEQRNDLGKRASLLFKVNYGASPYLMNTVDLLNGKLKDGDSLYLDQAGLAATSKVVKGVELEPIISASDVVRNYETSDRNLEIVLKYMQFEEEGQINELFLSDYRYYKAVVSMTSEGGRNEVEEIVAYFNNNDMLQDLKDETMRIIEDKIAANDRSIELMDKVVDTYLETNAGPLSDAQIYVERGLNMNQIFTAKAELLLENDEMRKQRIAERDVIILMGDPEVSSVQKGLRDKHMIIYPVVFVFAFLFLAWLRYAFISLRRYSQRA